MARSLIWIAALCLVAIACGESQDAATTQPERQSIVQDGILTGQMKMSFPLSGGDATVEAVEIELEDGSIVMAEWFNGVSDEIFAGMRVGATKMSDSEDYEWQVNIRLWDATLTGAVFPAGADASEAAAVEIELARTGLVATAEWHSSVSDTIEVGMKVFVRDTRFIKSDYDWLTVKTQEAP